MDILKQLEAGLEADQKFTKEAAERYVQSVTEWKTIRRQLVDTCIALRQSPVAYSNRIVAVLEARYAEVDKAIFECRYCEEVLTESDRTALIKDTIRKIESLKEHSFAVSSALPGITGLGLNTGITVLYAQDQFIAPAEGAKLVAKLEKRG